jgi:hypothetical protein
VKIPDELATLSRHLMLFLVAVFAFSSKALLESSSGLVRVLFTVALMFAFGSFIAGYRMLFHLYDQESRHPAEQDSAPATRSSIRRAQIQYALTVSALFFLIVAVMLSLWGTAKTPAAPNFGVKLARPGFGPAAELPRSTPA